MATNKQRAEEKAKREALENDPDYVAPSAEKDRARIVEDAIKSIKKESGVLFSRPGAEAKVLRPVLPTGIFGVDNDIFGAGGVPAGRITEAFGAPSAGKGTLTTQLIAETQRRYIEHDNCAIVDAECAYDAAYAAKLGVDNDRLLIAQPENGEDALQATLDIISTGLIKLCIVDSVSALVPRAELEGSMTDAHMGLQARLMGQGLRKLTSVVSRTGCALVFINQTRSNLGVTFGNPTTTSGGKALTFFSSVRVQIDRISQIKEKDVNVGNKTKIKGVKNKTSVPFRESTFDLMFDMPGRTERPGFDAIGSLTDYAIEYGVWVQSGAKYALPSTSEVITGRANLRAALRDNKETRKVTERATLVAMGKSDQFIKRALRGI